MPPSQPIAGAGRAGALGGTELWPLRAVHISAGGGGELYIAMLAGRPTQPQAAAGRPIALTALSTAKHAHSRDRPLCWEIDGNGGNA